MYRLLGFEQGDGEEQVPGFSHPRLVRSGIQSTYFTKLDLRYGYWQTRIAKFNESKTTCVTCYSSFEFLVIPFGLTNVLATFCNLMMMCSMITSMCLWLCVWMML